MARSSVAVVLLALLCGQAAFAAPVRLVGARRLLGAEWVGGINSGFNGGGFGLTANNIFAQHWLAGRGLATANAAATVTGGGGGGGFPSMAVDPSLMGFLGTNNAAAAARAIAGGGMDMDGAAWSLLNAAQGGNTAAVASAFASTAGVSGPAFTNVFARAAAIAMAQGGGLQTGFVTATAAAFAAAGANGNMGPFALAAADAMVQARGLWGAQFGSEFAGMFGSAMAQAVAAGNGGAVAEATATVFCSGTNAQAAAFSEAIAQSIAVNPATGCVIVQRVVAVAQAMCANGVATAMAQSFVTRQILPGTCNVFGFAGLPTTGAARATATATTTTGGLVGGLIPAPVFNTNTTTGGATARATATAVSGGAPTLLVGGSR